jgi:hypothetical protein
MIVAAKFVWAGPGGAAAAVAGVVVVGAVGADVMGVEVELGEPAAGVDFATGTATLGPRTFGLEATVVGLVAGVVRRTTRATVRPGAAPVRASTTWAGLTTGATDAV